VVPFLNHGVINAALQRQDSVQLGPVHLIGEDSRSGVDPMAATPAEQLLVAEATNCTVGLTVLLLNGALTCTEPPDLTPATAIDTGVFAVPPQWSHSWTTVL